MAKISFLDLPPGYDSLFKKALQPGDRFTLSRIRVKTQFLSRNRVKHITLRSLQISLAPVWASLSSPDKAAWTSAGAASGLTGWKMFVYDTAARRRAGFTGYATPNDIYQALVGRITVNSPATGLLIEQPHPLNYFIYKKVTGTRSQFNPVPVTESFGFPLEIGISWHSDLVAAGVSPRARFYCVVISSYQGRDIETVLEIPFGLTDDWQRSTASLSTVLGPVQGYAAFIEVYNCTGNLYFDNVEIKHNTLNWARDPDCNNIAQEFTKQYEQIPKHWAPVNLVDGDQFGSVYFNDTVDHSLDLLELESGFDIETEAGDPVALESYIPSTIDHSLDMLELQDGQDIETEAAEPIALESYVP